jgi:hypothetical protein
MRTHKLAHVTTTCPENLSNFAKQRSATAPHIVRGGRDFCGAGTWLRRRLYFVFWAEMKYFMSVEPDGRLYQLTRSNQIAIGKLFGRHRDMRHRALSLRKRRRRASKHSVFGCILQDLRRVGRAAHVPSLDLFLESSARHAPSDCQLADPDIRRILECRIIHLILIFISIAQPTLSGPYILCASLVLRTSRACPIECNHFGSCSKLTRNAQSCIFGIGCSDFSDERHIFHSQDTFFPDASTQRTPSERPHTDFGKEREKEKERTYVDSAAIFLTRRRRAKHVRVVFDLSEQTKPRASFGLPHGLLTERP